MLKIYLNHVIVYSRWMDYLNSEGCSIAIRNYSSLISSVSLYFNDIRINFWAWICIPSASSRQIAGTLASFRRNLSYSTPNL